MRFSFTIPVGALVLAALCAGTAGASSYQQATDAMKAGDYSLAAELLEQTIEASPPWAAGHVALAQCQFLLGLPERAETSLATALEIDPKAGVFEGYAFGGMKLYGAQRYSEAIRPLEQALQRAPEAKASPISKRLANALFQAGKYVEARDRLQQHLDRFGFDAGLAYFLALSLRQSGEPEAALGAMREAVDGGLPEPKLGRAVERLARWSAEHAWATQKANERETRMREALGHASAWRDRDPRSAAALDLWFEVARAGGDVANATEWLEQATAGDAGGCLERTLLAEAYALAKRPDDAARAAGAAVACDDGSGRAHYTHGLALLTAIEPEYESADDVVAALERLEQAQEVLSKATVLDPSLETRVAKLRRSADVTGEALDEALQSFIKRGKIIERDREARILARCRTLHWNLKTDRAAVSESDRAFYDENDCRGRVAEQPGG